MFDQEILNETLKCLLPHKHPSLGDKTEIDVFNRLLAKNIRPEGWTQNTHIVIKREQIESRREKWTTIELGKLKRGHSSTDGDDFECPVIIVEYDGEQRVLDGIHRINRWVESEDTRIHNVNYHTISEKGKFAILP